MASSPMRLFRQIHLCLGCTFAPLIIFFAGTGIAQTLGLQFTAKGSTGPNMFTYLATIHTSRGLKVAGGLDTLSSPIMKWLVIAMATSLILTTILGVVMTLESGRPRTTAFCLSVGVLAPIALVLIAAL